MEALLGLVCKRCLWKGIYCRQIQKMKSPPRSSVLKALQGLYCHRFDQNGPCHDVKGFLKAGTHQANQKPSGMLLVLETSGDTKGLSRWWQVCRYQATLVWKRVSGSILCLFLKFCNCSYGNCRKLESGHHRICCSERPPVLFIYGTILQRVE